MSRDFHKLDPDAFEQACLYGHGAIVGWMSGTGHQHEIPHMTAALKAAYERAFESVYNAGYAAAVDHQTSDGLSAK